MPSVKSFVCLLAAGVLAARAADVTVVKPGAMKSPIDLSGLQADGSGPAGLVLQTLEADLARSGWFTIAAAGRGAIRVSGTVADKGGEVRAKCEVTNVANAQRYLSDSFRGGTDAARRLAHRISDEIVWRVKRRRGIAGTRIVMVGSREGRKDVFVCDADGHNMLQVTRDGAICMSPRWAPRGDLIYYTSFHRGFPDVYELDLAAKSRKRIVAFPGLNAGADVSPDGHTMVLTLSKDGNPDLYLVDLKSRRQTRLTRTRYAAEASPSWSPYGKRIAFVSDKSGSPQLYVTDRDGAEHSRITFQGSENVAPDWGPTGRIVCSSRRGGRYQVCVIDPPDWRATVLTRSPVDHEEPSWARDGRHIVCVRTENYRSALYVLDTMGDAPVRLFDLSGDWYSPDWSSE